MTNAKCGDASAKASESRPTPKPWSPIPGTEGRTRRWGLDKNPSEPHFHFADAIPSWRYQPRLVRSFQVAKQ